MADVRPFAGLRFDPSRAGLGRVLCPPYDVIDPDQARRLRRERSSAIHLELPAGKGAARYAGAARTFRRWRKSGLLLQDRTPSFYVVEETFRLGGRRLKRVGFLAALGVAPRAAKAILPHEKTLAKPKADRLRLLAAVRANISPIFGIFPDSGGSVRKALRAALKGRPAASGVMKSGVAYRLWPLSEPRRVGVIRRALAAKRILIADGHHRYEVSRTFYKRHPSQGAETVLAYLCPEEDSGLVVLPTHRIVSGGVVAAGCRVTPCRSSSELLKTLSRQRNPYAFGLYDGTFKLAVPRAANGCRSGLCVEWLRSHLLAEIPPDRLKYTPDPVLAAARARRENGTAVFVKPMEVAQIRRAVRAVGLLPQKSTYFFPKIATGLVFKSLK